MPSISGPPSPSHSARSNARFRGPPPPSAVQVFTGFRKSHPRASSQLHQSLGIRFSLWQNSSDTLADMHQMTALTRAGKPYVAWLKCHPDQPASRCYVHEISDSGAKVKVWNESELPNQFELIFSRRGDARIFCRMVARRQYELEVRFVPLARSSSN
jgi:hypothetical protein